MRPQPDHGKMLLLLISSNTALVNDFKQRVAPSVEVMTSKSGDDVLPLIHLSWSAIFLDIDSDEYDGLNMLRRIKDVHQSVEVVAVSSKLNPDRCVLAMRHGAYGYLMYPFSDQELQMVLHSIRDQEADFKKIESIAHDVFVDQIDTRMLLLKELMQLRRASGGFVSGDEFMAFFPLHQRKDVQLISSLKTAMSAAEFDQLKRGNPPVILVVEDEPNVRHGLVQILEDYGFETIEAGDGESALNVAQAAPTLDLILMDIGLPGGVLGVDLISPLKTLHPDVEIIMLTAYKSVEYIVHSFTHFVFDYVTKPYDKNDLLIKISKALQKRCFKKIMPDIGKSLLNVVLSPKAKFKILNDIAKKRMSKNLALLMGDVYLFFPELEGSQIPRDTKITADIVSDGLGLFVDTLLSEMESGKSCQNFVKKWKTYF